MKLSTIQSSFRKTGLIPLDPTPVLKKLKLYQGRQNIESDHSKESESDESSEGFATPPPPPRTPTPPLSWVEWPTPLTLRTRKKGVDYVRERNLAIIANS